MKSNEITEIEKLHWIAALAYDVLQEFALIGCQEPVKDHAKVLQYIENKSHAAMTEIEAIWSGTAVLPVK